MSARRVGRAALQLVIVVIVVIVLANATAAGGFAWTSHAAPAGPLRAHTHTIWGRQLRICHTCAAASLEDRQEEVEKIRSAARGVLGKLLNDMVSTSKGSPGGEAGGGQISEAMKSAAPREHDFMLGFLGTGAITRAVVTGLCRHSCAHLKIILSPRSAATAAELAAMWPDKVSVAQSNQAVVDASSIVCVAVLPSQYSQVLREISFRRDHTVLSFISTAEIADIQRVVAPATRVFRALPMPLIAQGEGPLPIYPSNPEISDIFCHVSAVIELEEESEFVALMTLSALRAPFYYLQQAAEMWARAQGVRQEVASRFVGEMFAAFAADSKSQRQGFSEITRACQTPGGINEQALEGLRRKGFYSMLQAQLDVILALLSNSKTQ